MRTQSNGKGMVGVVEIKQAEALASFAERWDGVVAASPSANIFATSDWLEAWWRHFGSGRQLWLLLMERDGGEAVGVLPCMLTEYQAGGLGLLVLELPGADIPTCADHLELICAPGWEQAATEAVGRHLLETSQRWDVARWTAAPAGSMTLEGLAGVLRSRGCRSTKLSSISCPYLPLEGPWEAYDAHLERKFRDLRKYIRAVDARKGRFLLVRNQVELSRVLSELQRLNRLRVRSKGGIPSLERDDFFAFLGEVCERFLRQGWLRLHALEVAGEIIAVNLNFAFGNKVYGYMSGFDPAWTRHGIGTVLMRHVIKSSAEEGFQEYDFLRGDEGYKYRWTSQQRVLTTVRLVRNRVRYWGFAGGRLAERFCSKLSSRVFSGNGRDTENPNRYNLHRKPAR